MKSFTIVICFLTINLCYRALGEDEKQDKGEDINFGEILQKSNCDKRYDEKQVFSEEKLQVSEGKSNLPITKSTISYDVASNQLKSDFINSSDEQDAGLQKPSPINTKENNFRNGVITASKSNQSKISFMNKKNATLRLEISNQMLNPASSHSVKKIRREAVVEAPIMTTHF